MGITLPPAPITQLSPRWDDISFSAGAINPPGAPTAATFDGDWAAYLFSANSDQYIGGSGQIPHGFKIGSPLRPHVHWTVLNVGNQGAVKLRLEWTYRDVSSTDPFPLPGSWNTYDLTLQVPATARLHSLSSFGDVESASITRSAIFLWKIGRIALDPADTFNQPFFLLSFDIHTILNDLGSVSEYGD